MHCSYPINSAPGAGPKEKKGLKRKTSKRGHDPNAHLVCVWIEMKN